MNIALSKIIVPSQGKSFNIPLPLRRDVLERHNHTCQFCGEPTDKLCHDLPKCRGGETTLDNLLTCCRLCSREKQELTASEYRNIIKLRKENVFEEVIAMTIEVHFVNGEVVTGEVENEPSFRSREFYLKVGHDGKRRKINTRNMLYFDILGGRGKK